MENTYFCESILRLRLRLVDTFRRQYLYFRSCNSPQLPFRSKKAIVFQLFEYQIPIDIMTHNLDDSNYNPGDTFRQLHLSQRPGKYWTIYIGKVSLHSFSRNPPIHAVDLASVSRLNVSSHLISSKRQWQMGLTWPLSRRCNYIEHMHYRCYHWHR